MGHPGTTVVVVVIRLLYTLRLCQNSYWKRPFIVSFPTKNGGSFQFVFCECLPCLQDILHISNFFLYFQDILHTFPVKPPWFSYSSFSLSCPATAPQCHGLPSSVVERNVRLVCSQLSKHLGPSSWLAFYREDLHWVWGFSMEDYDGQRICVLTIHQFDIDISVCVLCMSYTDRDIRWYP